MAKKNKLPEWLVESAKSELNSKAYSASRDAANAKFLLRDALKAWYDAKDEWERTHPYPGDEKTEEKLEDFADRLLQQSYKKIDKIIRAANAGKLTEAQLLKAVEEFT